MVQRKNLIVKQPDNRDHLRHTYARQYLHREVLSLIHKGYSPNRIAKMLHLTYSFVRNVYWQAIESLAEENKQYATLLATRQLNEIRAMMESIAMKVHNGDLDAIETNRKLLQDEAKLLALYPKDTPTEINVIVVDFPSPHTRQSLDDGNTVQGTVTVVNTGTDE